MEEPGARQREEDPLEPLLGPEITVAAGDCTCHEEEELAKGGKIVNWRPGKGRLARNVSDGESHQSRFSGCPCYESDTTHSDSSGTPIKYIGDFDDFQSDLENWELDDEACAVSFPELKIDSQYEEEDWDKELEDAACNPYDAEDINCGSLQENCLLASCAWQEESLYNPRCHHAAPLSLSSPNRMPEVGQFDDADD
ncbi:coordinator of PRMT5 and differentiation stimulator isoform X1 [Gopherus evgoodei]|uniref:coordinator of PRMT5 and differentiation stimulator isoform X1 n=1 Tax=Gopherus evgoodei TaxID=1825980 RepID=UPI0011CEF040|nr:coordinator of PRMT5 and differentiation stimulator isoform X1 [Gopherus evgoodei]